MNTFAKGCLTAVLVTGIGASQAIAQDFGSADEAREMLTRVVEAMNADPEGTIAAINEGEAGGWVDRDLYPFCGDSKGDFIAHAVNQSLVGQSLRDLQGRAGSPLGENIYAAAASGDVSEVSYMWPRPGEEEPVQKHAYVAQIGDVTCAVGYYE